MKRALTHALRRASLLWLVGLGAAAQAQETVHTIAPGEAGAGVTARVLSVAPGKAQLSLMAAKGKVSGGGRPPSLLALSHRADLLLPRSRPRYLMTAGRSHADQSELPAGLLISDGQVLGTLDTSPASDGRRQRCPSIGPNSHRLPGLLCVPSADTASWQLQRLADYQPGSCRQAVQLGPYLVEPGGKVNGCTNPQGEAGERLAVCQDIQGHLHLVHTGSVKAEALATWLATGPLKCDSALSLGARDASGWIALPRTPRPLVGQRRGAVDAPVASALLVAWR